MKTLTTSLLAASFFLATYVAAPRTAHAGRWLCSQTATDPESAEKRVNNDIDLAIDVSRHGLPCRIEVEALQASVEAEHLTYVGLPDQCVIQMMLARELADLHARAVNYVAHEAEVRQAQFQVVLARYERAVFEIRAAWQSGAIAEDVATKAIYTMRVDAFDYLESLGLASIRARLEEALAELIARGSDAMNRAEALRDTFKKLYELRLEASLKVLEARITGGTFSKFDYQRVQEAVRGLESLESQFQPHTCGS